MVVAQLKMNENFKLVKNPNKDTISILCPDRKGGVRPTFLSDTGLTQKQANKIFGGKII